MYVFAMDWGVVRTKGRRDWLVVVALSWIVGLPILAGLDLGRSAEIPVIAYVLNAAPQILGVQVFDEASKPTTSVDPGSSFFLDIFW